MRFSSPLNESRVFTYLLTLPSGASVRRLSRELRCSARELLPRLKSLRRRRLIDSYDGLADNGKHTLRHWVIDPNAPQEASVAD